jgi:hypothetical protein
MCPVCTLEAMRTQMPPTEPLLAKDFRGRMSESVMQKLKFDERGLLPAIVQDAETNEANAGYAGNVVLEPFAAGVVAQGRDFGAYAACG